MTVVVATQKIFPEGVPVEEKCTETVALLIPGEAVIDAITGKMEAKY